MFAFGMRYDLEAGRAYRNKWHYRAFRRIDRPIGYRALAGLGGVAAAGLAGLYPYARRAALRVKGLRVAPNEGKQLEDYPKLRAHIKGSTALAKRPAGTLTEYYPVVKRYKASMGDGGDTQMADSSATTEAALGWGVHDAKTLYSRRKRFSKKGYRKRYRRAKAKGSFSRSQKRYLKSKIHARGGVKLPTCLTLINKHTLYTHSGDGGTSLGVDTIGGLFHPGENLLNTAAEKHLDIHTLFKQLYAQADVTDGTGLIWQTGSAFAKMRLNIKSAKAHFTMHNNSTQNMLVKLFTFSCKKSITVDEMTNTTEMSLLSACAASPNSLGSFFWQTQYLEEDAGADHSDMAHGTPFQFDPRFCLFAKKYLSLEKIQRWEMAASSIVQFDYKSRIGLSINYPTCLKYFAIKGVTNFFVFQIQSAPYVETLGHTIQASRGIAADTGVVVHLQKEYAWSPVWNSIDDLSVSQKHKFTPSASVHTAGTAQDNTAIVFDDGA